MLIRRDVIEETRSMWWDPNRDEVANTETQLDRWFEYTDTSEDIIFCEKAKAAGFKLYADLSCRLGHITTAVITPSLRDGEWVTGVTIGRDAQLWMPRAEMLLAEQEAELQLEEELDPAEQPVPVEPPSHPGAERIEIWVDEEYRWWWRAIDDDGQILVKDSGVSENVVLAAADARFPGAPVYLIQREVEDSREIRPYRVPGRMWARDIR